jgi:5-methylcytosine-specific restriction endonuclease McrA
MSVTHIPAELRRAVRQRANGSCEYCRIPEEDCLAYHEVDHVIAEKHTGETKFENLALCCTLCNRRRGSDSASIDPESAL